MSRKRKSDQQSTETPAATETPTQAETATAVAEPPASEAQPEGRSFAEKVGKKKYVPDPDPFPFASDAVAGVRLFQSKRDQQMAIKFGDGSPKEKPSQAVLETMREAGWKWDTDHRVWALPFTPESARQTHIEAEAFYQELRHMIRQEKGIEAAPEHGVPF